MDEMPVSMSCLLWLPEIVGYEVWVENHLFVVVCRTLAIGGFTVMALSQSLELGRGPWRRLLSLLLVICASVE